MQFSPRHPNAARAHANWERKSQYLLREIVKFRTYIDTLAAAQIQKQKIYAEREALEDKESTADEDASQIAEVGVDGAKKTAQAKPLSKQISTPAFLH
jgi:protein-disulfide isomerase